MLYSEMELGRSIPPYILISTGNGSNYFGGIFCKNLSTMSEYSNNSSSIFSNGWIFMNESFQKGLHYKANISSDIEISLFYCIV